MYGTYTPRIQGVAAHYDSAQQTTVYYNTSYTDGNCVVRPGTVYIRSRGVGQEASGTGVVVDAAEGLVLTNFHVIALGPDLQAGTPQRLDDAEVRAAAPCEDLALLHVEGLESRRAIPLGRQADVQQGDQVVALGYPANYFVLNPDVSSSNVTDSGGFSKYNALQIELRRRAV